MTSLNDLAATLITDILKAIIYMKSELSEFLTLSTKRNDKTKTHFLCYVFALQYLQNLIKR